MTYRSHTAAPSRVFDHLYDPIYTSSDQRNVFKEDCIALMRSAPIQIYPVLNSMFSEMSYEERNCYAYQKNALPYTPIFSESVKQKYLCVTGSDRTKFFKNPLYNVQKINVGMMVDENITSSCFHNAEVSICNVGCQTVLRESSAQTTKPFLPECFAKEFVNDQNMPEVAFIAEFLHTFHYPGLKEVEVVERSRKRRQWETSLPPIHSPEDITSRATALEVFEWEEWITREREINDCQQERLKIVADLIMRREKTQKSLYSKKNDHCKKKVLQERTRQKSLLLQKYQRNMRKIDLAQRKDSMRERATDVVLNHFDRKNDYSFPKIDLDIFRKKPYFVEYTEKLETRFNTMEKDGNSTLEDLQRYLQSKKRDTLWKPKKSLNEVERGIWNENYLKNLHKTLKLYRFKNLATKRTPLKIYKEFTSNTACQMVDDQTDQAFKEKFLIQKAIKGRVIQKIIEKGVKNFEDIIEEAKEEFSDHINIQNRITLELKEIEKCLKNDETLQEDLKRLESEENKNYISFLERELQRLQNEKRAHALYILAERERYFRMNNQKLDESFRNDAISFYLEDVLIEGVHGESTQTDPRKYVRDLIQKIDKIASTNVDFEFNSKKKQENTNSNKQSYTEHIKDHIHPQIVDKINCEHLRTKQNIVLKGIHENLFREEFYAKELDTQNKICNEIITDLIEKVIHLEGFALEKCPGRQDSIEAEELASKIVDKILSEINSSRDERNSHEHDDFDNISSLTETESSIDRTTGVLAKQVVQHALINVLKDKSTNETDSSDF